MNLLKKLFLTPLFFLGYLMASLFKKISGIIKGYFKKELRSSLLWFLLTLLFGLLQSWLVFEESVILQNVNFKDALDELILSGALLFFSTAIIASLTIDYFLLRQANFPKRETGSHFVLFPAIILILSVSIFILIHRKSINEIDYEVVRAMQFGILTATGVYAIYVKMKLLRFDQQNKESE